MREQKQAEIERNEMRRDKRRSDQIESSGYGSDQGEVRRVQPPRTLNLKEHRLAVVLILNMSTTSHSQQMHIANRE